MDELKTFGSAKTLDNLIYYYCFRCRTGLYNCSIPAVECPKIMQDRDFESVMSKEAEQK